MALECLGLRMVVSRDLREQSRSGQGRSWDWTWTQQAVVLAITDSVGMSGSQEPGSHRGPGLGVRDPLPAPSVWGGPA